MARPVGTRNQDFEEKRSALLRKLTGYLLRSDVIRPSFRQLAIAAETSEPTLRHYFQNRSGVIVDAFGLIQSESEHFRDTLRQPTSGSVDAVRGYFSYIEMLVKSERYTQAHVLGIRESLEDDDVKAAYLNKFVGPGVEALAERLSLTPGPPNTEEDARSAAMMIVASSVAFILHQEVLNGGKHMPFDREAYFSRFSDWFLNGLVNDEEK